MSLTSEISNPHSEVSLYFKHNFNFSLFLEDANSELKKFHTLLPTNKQNYPWPDVGHMVEYLMLLHIGLPVEELFPLVYARKKIPFYFSEIKRKYNNITPYFSSKDKFNDLCNDLFRFSKVEKMIRSGDNITDLNIKTFTINSIILHDMIQIYFKSLKVNSIINDKNSNFCYNPIFDLSALVGGADADLYLKNKNGNTLIDLKTTIRPQVTEDMLFQLLGYTFLDLTNQHQFKEVGIYLTRQNLISNWSLNQLVKENSVFSNYELAKDKFVKIIYNKNRMNNCVKKTNTY